jgi:hypothetical protein
LLDVSRDAVRLACGHDEARVVRAIEFDNIRSPPAVHDGEVLAKRAAPSPDGDHPEKTGTGRANAPGLGPCVIDYANLTDRADRYANGGCTAAS